jgi:hypothetical protein
MLILDFIMAVFCLIDEECKRIDNSLRQRGFEPNLSYYEFITIEVLGGFLGINKDKGYRNYFKPHCLNLFTIEKLIN